VRAVPLIRCGRARGEGDATVRSVVLRSASLGRGTSLRGCGCARDTSESKRGSSFDRRARGVHGRSDALVRDERLERYRTSARFYGTIPTAVTRPRTALPAGGGLAFGPLLRSALGFLVASSIDASLLPVLDDYEAFGLLAARIEWRAGCLGGGRSSIREWCRSPSYALARAFVDGSLPFGRRAPRSRLGFTVPASAATYDVARVRGARFFRLETTRRFAALASALRVFLELDFISTQKCALALQNERDRSGRYSSRARAQRGSRRVYRQDLHLRRPLPVDATRLREQLLSLPSPRLPVRVSAEPR
jgi:hypothetical protein